ncbi:MAG: hypothetical protein AB8H79_12015 [Myxococcota bacterium]
MLRPVAALVMIATTACGPVTDFNGYTELEGELDYRLETTDGEVICDVQMALVGTPYTGACSDCEFAFHVESEVLQDNGSADCELPSVWTYVDDDFIGNSGLGYSDATVTIDGDPIDEALVAVGDLYGQRPASAGVVSNLDVRSTVTWDGEANLEWSHRFDDLHGPDRVWDRDQCPAVDELPELKGRKIDGAYSAREDLDCDGYIMDVWTFEGRADERIELAMDTVAADTAFDTSLIIEGPDGCLIAEGDDVFECTFAPLDFSCGGGKFTPTVSGTHKVIALSYGYCTSGDADLDGRPDIGEYELSIDAPYDPKLTLEEDDAPRTEELVVTTVSGSVSVIRGGE